MIRYFKVSSILFFVLGLLLNIQSLSAQQEYTDHKPVYRKWQDSYILDKIEYTKSSTVFYFRFVCRSGQGISAIFYPPGGEYPWYLKDRSGGKAYELKAIKNIRRNSELMVRTLRRRAEYPSLDGFGYTVFSCEVHFDRLPNTVKEVDLIEGKGMEFNQNHFNCFNVRLKTWDDKSLGEIKDSEENVRKFEQKFGVNTKKNIKPKPRIEPKVDPKPKEDPVVVKVDPPKPKEEPKPEPKVDPKPKKDPKKDPNNPYKMHRVNSKDDIICGEKLVLDNLQFHDGTTDFKGMVQCKQAMFAVFEYMKENPTSRATIIGHTDIFGPVERNMDLSERRAQKVQRWLSMMGIDPFRIDIEFYGPKQPIVPEGDPINRRVEVKIDCKG
jgi:outer membrane protein OmpA-like peptidoglycan-associated protein